MVGHASSCMVRMSEEMLKNGKLEPRNGVGQIYRTRFEYVFVEIQKLETVRLSDIKRIANDIRVSTTYVESVNKSIHKARMEMAYTRRCCANA